MWSQLVLVLLTVSPSWGNGPQVQIPAGKYVSFFKEVKEQKMKVPSFSMDTYPVTNADFDRFVRQNPQFAKSKISRIYADEKYLQDWPKDLLPESFLTKNGHRPITSVSWFMARKYCAWRGMRLPTIAEWEWAGDVENPDVLQELLVWYAKTGDIPLEDVGKRKANKYGLHDMHGLIWEWVEDFNSVMISSDSRSKGDRTDGFFCGGGSINAKDAKAYATFMRYGFRSGLRGDYNIKTLGFRCVSDLPKGKHL